MDFYVETPGAMHLVMRTEDGRVVLVLPAPPESLPAAKPAENLTEMQR